jgi:class 3 adenylate cyclase/tetratricopeptide (TPR) repeat protein
MNDTPEQIEATITALEEQRSLLGDAVVDSALAPLRRELAARRSREKMLHQQLKQVSVLFIDVVGSTAMGQQLQPEDIHAVMDGALERFTAVVQANRGRVLQYTGDGMLAAFGADESHEDDVESAILAGLGIIEAAQRHAPRVRRMHGVPDFNVRAGINTGTVLLGGGVDAEGSIRGAVVNIAARMEQSAPAGSLRISHDTYRHVRGMFDVAAQPPISVKGIDAPVRSYLVQGARPRAFRGAARGIEGVQTRMVGRDRELEQLQAALQTVVAEQALRAVTVVGDAGLGKSRLLSEFQNTLERRPAACWLLLGRAHPRSALHPYGLLRDLVTRQLQITDGDSAAAARSKLVEGLAPLFGDEGDAPAHLLGQLIGLDFSASPHVARVLTDAAQIRDRAFQAIEQFLRRLAASSGTPVAVVLDDLHWADDGSLDFVQHLLQSNRDMPLLVLVLTRPDLIERRVDWADGDARHARLDLTPLDRTFSNQLAESLLQRIAQVPPALQALIIGGAEGNPFYMEELVKMLIDDGVIAADLDGWRVLPDKLLKVRVPPTLTGVLQVRMDALDAPEKTALQQAAVIGQVFSDQALAAIDPAAPGALPTLLRRQLIVKRGAPTADGTNEYAFQHNLLHQVAYDGVLKGPRRTGHAKVGQFWSTRAEVGGPQDVDPAACRALVEAHYHRCQSDPQAYAVWFDGQFTNYLRAYALQTLRPLAEGLIEICVETFGDDHPETAKAMTNLARVILGQGDVEKAEPLLRRAIAIQEQAHGPDHPDTARTVAVLGGYFSGRGDLRTAEPFFRRALQIRERALGPEHPLTVLTLDNVASIAGELGRYDEAEALSRRVLEIRERLLGPDHPDTSLALTALGDVLSKKKDHAAAEPLVRRALAAQMKNLPAEHPDLGLSMWHLAEALHGLGRHAEAEPLARRSLELWETSLGPNHEWTAWSLSSLAKLRLAQGDAVEAVQLAARALEIHQQALGPNHPTVAENLDILARALHTQGENAAAEPLLVRALAILLDHVTADDPAAQATRDLLAQTRTRLLHR